MKRVPPPPYIIVPRKRAERLKINCARCSKEFELVVWAHRCRLKASKSGKLFCSKVCSVFEMNAKRHGKLNG